MSGNLNILKSIHWIPLETSLPVKANLDFKFEVFVNLVVHKILET